MSKCESCDKWINEDDERDYVFTKTNTTTFLWCYNCRKSAGLIPIKFREPKKIELDFSDVSIRKRFINKGYGMLRYATKRI